MVQPGPERDTLGQQHLQSTSLQPVVELENNQLAVHGAQINAWALLTTSSIYRNDDRVHVMIVDISVFLITRYIRNKVSAMLLPFRDVYLNLLFSYLFSIKYFRM